jgi:glucosamine-6-phosphate deaminase
MAGNVQIKVCKDAASVALEAAKMIADAIKKKPSLVLGLATGSTPEGTYGELAKLYKAKAVSFEKVVTLQPRRVLGP